MFIEAGAFIGLCLVASLAAQVDAVTRTVHFVDSASGIRVYVRKVVHGNGRGVPILLVHGGSPPGEVVFDIRVPGYSLAEDLAKAGHPVFIADVRGWGRSTWRSLMDSTDPRATPAVTSAEALEDIDAAVRWVKKDRTRQDRAARARYRRALCCDVRGTPMPLMSVDWSW
jgi:alpha-beta hydrolase superfamily lysophospholipase